MCSFTFSDGGDSVDATAVSGAVRWPLFATIPQTMLVRGMLLTLMFYIMRKVLAIDVLLSALPPEPDDEAGLFRVENLSLTLNIGKEQLLQIIALKA